MKSKVSITAPISTYGREIEIILAMAIHGSSGTTNYYYLLLVVLIPIHVVMSTMPMDHHYFGLMLLTQQYLLARGKLRQPSVVLRQLERIY